MSSFVSNRDLPRPHNRSNSFPMQAYLNSRQTTAKKGTVVSTEYDRVWGTQFLIRVDYPDQSYEFFWMRHGEVSLAEQNRRNA